MNIFKPLTIIFLAVFLVSCGSNSAQKKMDISIKTNTDGQAISIDKTLELDISNPKNHEISSVKYTIDGKPVSQQVDLKSFRLESIWWKQPWIWLEIPKPLPKQLPY